MDLRYFDAAAVAAATPYAGLVDVLAHAFAKPPITPPRQHLDIDPETPGRMTLLSMPAWQPGEMIGHKLVTITPGNTGLGMPTLNGFYLVFDGQTGLPLAMMDAAELTARRTAAASALAARLLARQEVQTLLIVGTGKLARYLSEAHASVRSYDQILVWGRNPEKAKALASMLEEAGLSATATVDLEAATRVADVVSCATTAIEPVISGAWLTPGCHLDLVGAFRPDMRECDDTAVQRAQVFVDTFEGALHEAGDLVQPIAAGVIDRDHILAELGQLVRGEKVGRTTAAEITLFKSVGASLEDFSAAKMVLDQ